MSDFPSGAICVVGLAKVANQNPIHSVHRALAGSFIVDPSSGLVYDVQFDTVCQITSDFLASLLIGLSLHTDLEEMISRVQSRYFGDSRRAITVILRDVAARLRECQGAGTTESFFIYGVGGLPSNSRINRDLFDCLLAAKGVPLFF